MAISVMKAVKSRLRGISHTRHFFAVGAALSGKVELLGLDEHSLQGDKKIYEILSQTGAYVEGYTVSKQDHLKPFKCRRIPNS